MPANPPIPATPDPPQHPFPPTAQYRADVLFRRFGRQRNGEVQLRDFDQGLVETLGGVPFKRLDGSYAYAVSIPGVTPPPGMPGVPIGYQYSEDIFEKARLPYILCLRDGVDPAMNRWHPGGMQYRAPADIAVPVIVQGPNGPVAGHSHYEDRPQAEPNDLSYSVTILSTRRGLTGSDPLLKIQRYVRRILRPYGYVVVTDSIGDLRTYSLWKQSESEADAVAIVGEHFTGTSFTLTIEGELDNDEPLVHRAVTQRAVVRTRQL